MGVLEKSQRLVLFYCSFTCIYLSVILVLLKFNNSLYNVGSYKFLPILVILMFAEMIKLSFSLLQSDSSPLIKQESKLGNNRSRKTLSKYSKDFVKFLVATVALSGVYYVFIVLFGAPVLTNREETSMLTMALTSLTFVPACLHLGVDGAIGVLTGQVSNTAMAQAVKTNVEATILGCWLGAIVIPLDWDQPWQVWPIPCVVGALCGYLFAHFLTLMKMLPLLRVPRKLHQ